MNCTMCEDDGYLVDSTLTDPIYCDCVAGAKALLGDTSTYAPMVSTDQSTIENYWTLARIKVESHPSLAKVTVAQVDAARMVLEAAGRE